MPSTMFAMNGSTAAGRPRDAARIVWPRSPVPVSWLRSTAPLDAGLEAVTTWAGTAGGQRSAASRSLWNELGEERADDRERDRPPICRKKVRFDVATPSMLNGTAFWDDSG
jgi:hypothetical protein